MQNCIHTIFQKCIQVGLSAYIRNVTCRTAYMRKRSKKRDQQIKKRLVRNEQVDISTKMSKISKFEVQHSTDFTMRWKGQI